MANLKTLKRIMHICRLAGLPVMQEGVHGIGKTSVCYQVWADVRRERGQSCPDRVDTLNARDLVVYASPAVDEYGLWAWAAPNVSIEEIIGYPQVDRDRKVLEYLRCHNFIPPPGHCGGGVMSVDELNLASEDIERALMSLMLEGRFLDYVLPAGVFLATSQNPATGEYHSRRLNPPTLDRFCLIKVMVEHQEVMDRFQGVGVRDEILDFLTTNAEALNAHQALVKDSDAIKYGTSRSWEFVNRVLPHLTPEDVEGSVALEVISGLVGNTAGALFTHALRHPERNPVVIGGAEVIDGYGVTKATLDLGYDDHKSETMVRRKVLRAARAATVRIDVLNRAAREVAKILAVDAKRIAIAIGGDIDTLSTPDTLKKARAVASEDDLVRWANAVLFFCDCPADMVDSHFMNTIVTAKVSKLTISVLGAGMRSKLTKDLMTHIDGLRRTERFMTPGPGMTSLHADDGDDQAPAALVDDDAAALFQASMDAGGAE